MVTTAENKIITQTGRGTPLGDLMRAYWLPVMRADRVVAGIAPVPFQILGERLVAFRTAEGVLGVINEACPHRGASMALARNEDCGLRCIYHGWLIAPQGHVLDAPTHPAGTPLGKFPNAGHPVEERQGMIWTWLGKGEPPSFPRLAFTDLPEDHVIAGTAVLNCDWLRPLETLWDSFHAQFLHNDTNRKSSRGDGYFSGGRSGGQRHAGAISYDYPRCVATRTDYGLYFENIDAAKHAHHKFILPVTLFHTVTPNPLDDKAVQMSVPIDDEHVLLWVIFFNRNTPLKPDGQGKSFFQDVVDLNNYMAALDVRTRENRWGQNRDAIERGESYNGVIGMGSATIIGEDAVIIESQARIDRSTDFLAPTDRPSAEGRRVVLEAALAHAQGATPPGRDLDLTSVHAHFVSLLTPQTEVAEVG